MAGVFRVVLLTLLILGAYAFRADWTLAEPPMVVSRPEVPGDASHPDATSDRGAANESAAVLYGPVKSDFSDLRASTRYVRVLVCYGRTEFFVADGRPRGFEYELLTEYQRFLNRKRKRGIPKIKLIFIPVRFGDLLQGLLDGKGDVAAGLISITEERWRRVAFTDPYLGNVKEVVVAYSGADMPATLDDLSGRQVHVLKGSSFVEHLRDLNGRLAAAGRAPVDVVELPSSVETEDILQMVNAGIIHYSIQDGFLAELWAKVYPDLLISKGISLTEPQSIGWAVRPGNPELLKSLNAFIATMKSEGVARCAALHRQYFKDVQRVKNPLGFEASYRTGQLCSHFKEWSGKNELDWLMMMAQGFQESGLIQELRGPSGAVGVMQIFPDTAKELGFRDVFNVSTNIAAGVTYMGHIRDQYFDEDCIPAESKLHFTLAAYNAGPNRVRRLRRLAADRGLDPNAWFNNVELVALDKVGEEVVQYVENILCYYLAYKMSYMMMEENKTGPGLEAN